MIKYYKCFNTNNLIDGIILIFFTILLLSSIQCRENPSENHSRRANSSSRQIPVDTIQNDYTILLKTMLLYEKGLAKYPDSTALLRELLEKCFNKKSNMFFLAGFGLSATDYSSEYEIQVIEQRQRARQQAISRALQLKLLLKDNALLPIEKINGRVLYINTVLEEIHDDTLCQLFKIPVSSIVVQQ